MDDKAKPGDVIVFTSQTLIDMYGTEEHTVIEQPNHKSNKYSGDCPWVEIDSYIYYIDHNCYRIIKRGVRNKIAVLDDVDAFLKKQREDNLRRLFT